MEAKNGSKGQLYILSVACILTTGSGPLAGGVASEVNDMKKTSSHLVNSSGLQS